MHKETTASNQFSIAKRTRVTRGAPPAMVLVAALLLLVPVSAHLGPEGSASSALYTMHNGFDTCRYEGFKEVCIGTDGVSGTYINYYENKYIRSPALFPDAYHGYGSATAWCDLEVQGSGTQGDQLLDEGRVDDEPTPGLIMDGTWDDGGIGGACHTVNHYDAPGYDSPGCSVGTAYAKDAVSGGEVWIGAACDSITTSGTMGFELCTFNEVFSLNPSLEGITSCLGNYTSQFVLCGADGVMDDVHYGTGGTGIIYPFPIGRASGCVSDDEAPAVFTYNYVEERNLSDLPVVVPATMGWIDSR